MEVKQNISEDINSIFQRFGIGGKLDQVTPVSIGHIHHTYLLKIDKDDQSFNYILQEINTGIFRHPELIVSNMVTVADHLFNQKYPREILKPISISGTSEYLIKDRGRYWRLLPYFNNTTTVNTVDDPKLAHEVAFTFGEYIRYLDNLDPSVLHVTIPNFHDTPLLHFKLKEIYQIANITKRTKANDVIKSIDEFINLLDYYKILHRKQRIVHYDTKVNNVLLDVKKQRGICVIDLDTLMPGMVSYDYGDMIRTMAVTADENEPDLTRVQFQEDIFNAITDGFLTGIKNALSPEEKDGLFYGAALIIYEQAIRFLADYLSGDIYYPVVNEDQNLTRSSNQLKLLREYLQFMGMRVRI